MFKTIEETIVNGVKLSIIYNQQLGTGQVCQQCLQIT